jgi:hypothetical protein
MTTFLIVLGIVLVVSLVFAWIRSAARKRRAGPVGYPGSHVATPYPGDHPSFHDGGPSGG